jgi:flagellar basal-body rod protein FlgC
MPENIFATFKISGQGMSVQRMRLNAVANNIANANTTKGPDGNPYQREVVVVRAIPDSPFEKELNGQLDLVRTDKVHSSNVSIPGDQPDYRTMQAISAKDSTPPRIVYDPSHPDADENGYVKMPNINVVTEMVEMITAQRAFEANAGVIEAAKNIVRDSLEI